VKELYANALDCAEPHCNEPLFTSRIGDVKRSLNSRMAHICARLEGGPRWDPDMPAEQNRGAETLLLLCIKHASVIDLLENVALYPAGLLREWKVRQLHEFDAAVGGWTLSDEEASEVIALSVSMPVTLRGDTINLGGGGGNASGAAGGGGTAIGSGHSAVKADQLVASIWTEKQSAAPGAGRGGGGGGAVLW
jgi:hypothetical protein